MERNGIYDNLLFFIAISHITNFIINKNLQNKALGMSIEMTLPTLRQKRVLLEIAHGQDVHARLTCPMTSIYLLFSFKAFPGYN